MCPPDLPKQSVGTLTPTPRTATPPRGNQNLVTTMYVVNMLPVENDALMEVLVNQFPNVRNLYLGETVHQSV